MSETNGQLRISLGCSHAPASSGSICLPAHAKNLKQWSACQFGALWSSQAGLTEPQETQTCQKRISPPHKKEKIDIAEPPHSKSFIWGSLHPSCKQFKLVSHLLTSNVLIGQPQRTSAGQQWVAAPLGLFPPNRIKIMILTQDEVISTIDIWCCFLSHKVANSNMKCSQSWDWPICVLNLWPICVLKKISK